MLLLLLWSVPAIAQPADCAAEPVGPEMRLKPRIALNGQPGMRAGMAGDIPIDLGTAPMFGTLCRAAREPGPEDILRGAPAPNGLLQGNGPRDVLHNRWQGNVTVQPPGQIRP